MVDIVSSGTLWELVKHAGRWLTNLRRAKESRKRESVFALRGVIIAAQRTSVYLRQLRDTGQRSYPDEQELSILWTELGFRLEDLGIRGLAERCQIKGKHWANPESMDPALLEKADVGLDRMEQLARKLLAEVNG